MIYLIIVLGKKQGSLIKKAGIWLIPAYFRIQRSLGSPRVGESCPEGTERGRFPVNDSPLRRKRQLSPAFGGASQGAGDRPGTDSPGIVRATWIAAPGGRGRWPLRRNLHPSRRGWRPRQPVHADPNPAKIPGESALKPHIPRHCEPVTDVTGVAIRLSKISSPMIPPHCRGGYQLPALPRRRPMVGTAVVSPLEDAWARSDFWKIAPILLDNGISW